MIILASIIAFCVPAFADTVDYDDYDPSGSEIIYDDTAAALKAVWDRGERSSKYEIKIYKGANVIQRKRISGSNYDLSNLVASKKGGSGKYKFSIRALKNPDENAWDVSDEYELGSTELKSIKDRLKKEQEEKESAQRGWIYSMDGTWKYYDKTGKPLKNTWLDEDGKRYHFSSNGLMQTGWQAIDRKWYCFDKNGVLIVNTKTPDGYTVNEAGEWIDDKGQPVSSLGSAAIPSNMTTLAKVSIGVSEKGKDPGTVKEAVFTGGTGVKIVSTEFSKPYEQWNAGEPVRVKLVISTTTNYQFGKRVSYSVRGVKSVSASGTGDTRTLSFSYYPKTQLPEPSGLFVSADGNLIWNKVSNAKSYKVTVTYGGVQIQSETVSDPEIWVGEYLDGSWEPDDETAEKIKDENPTINVKISAVTTGKKSSYFLTSNAATITDLRTWALNNTIDGELRKNGTSLVYKENGERFEGWKQLGGYWYFFKKGNAAGPGWYQDKDKLWYYFDEEHRMCTGRITVDGTEYFMNDGSNAQLPLGAWKE